MTITPVEIRHVKLRRGVLGYARRPADELLARIVASYEEAWRGRAELEDEVERLAGELGRYRELERLLRDALMSAERAAEDLRAQARREYELLLDEARLKAREIVAEAEAERERLHAEVRRLESSRSDLRARYRAFLRASLERLEDELGEPGASADLEDTGELRRADHAA